MLRARARREPHEKVVRAKRRKEKKNRSQRLRACTRVKLGKGGYGRDPPLSPAYAVLAWLGHKEALNSKFTHTRLTID